MKSLIIIFSYLFLFAFVLSTNSLAKNDLQKQTEIHWIVLKIGEEKSQFIYDLVKELTGQSEKITSAIFETETRLLTIHYTTKITLDDIYEIINKYIQDYEKVNGSQL